MAFPGVPENGVPESGVPENDGVRLPVTQLVAHLGTNPTVCVPVRADAQVDAAAIADHLAETAAFFGIAMPAPEVLRAALQHRPRSASRPRALDVLTVTLFADGDLTNVVSRWEPVTAWDATPVRIAGMALPAPVTAIPQWQRMAARTTSHAEADRAHRWLAHRGFADAISTTAAHAAPVLGALVFETSAGVCGLDGPAAVLDRLESAGVITPIARVTARPADATAVWWTSPRFETHPVSDLDGTPYPVGAPTRFLLEHT